MLFRCDGKKCACKGDGFSVHFGCVGSGGHNNRCKFFNSTYFHTLTKNIDEDREEPSKSTRKKTSKKPDKTEIDKFEFQKDSKYLTDEVSLLTANAMYIILI